ncbi:protein FAR1-RELATED SEQUENCE 5-like [Arachis duranensis]|uniref:Protein FAR1-RELATED SEQUENCE 5-like n=1 Tax=Arachis duranensis TaxID=130453 RepID=A0A9C6WQV1_ARADU|nr:protein FAR1-RELATED SEQUENCE 5-like [Arachis duranensis]
MHLFEPENNIKEVEESVKVLKDASKTRKVAAEKVLSALSVIEKAKIDPSGFLETLVGNESPGRTWMLIFTAEINDSTRMRLAVDLVLEEYNDLCLEVVGQEFSHEGVNSEHTSYDQYEQEEEKYEEVDVDYMDENDTSVEPMFDYHGFDEGYNIDSLEDIGMIEFWNIRDEDVCHFHFSDVDIAFEFYNRYARTRGFSARKNRSRKSRAGALKLKNFVCHREGFRLQNNYGIGNLKRKPTHETRCGCSAMMEIRVDAPSGRWFISYFSDEHNHPLLDPRLTGLLPGHRFMSEADIGHMVNMKKGGISVGQIYRALANQAGGYEYLSFTQRDMYNKIAKQRRQLPGDAYAALKYLEDQATNDPSLYFNHHMDADGTLRNLFWCDGLSRADYSLFGDVLAFDATYKRNKYMCPLVVFSGVNHHNQTIIFAAALICDEEKDTYRWLLQQLKVAMNGKAPVSVITDGDLSMKFAIEKEFPNAHHRLCAWHLIRNAISNIGKPQFTSMFKKCMLGDYEIDVFHQKWFKMVERFGVENKNWVLDMYKKRHSWATAHIRGKFFAGFRTTSRCEGLNSIIAKYVNSRYNLVEFIQHFNRCVDHMRWKEVQADLASVNGRPSLQTYFQQLERSAVNVYTLSIFHMFQPILVRAASMKVINMRQTGSYVIYSVDLDRMSNEMWCVFCCDNEMEFNCSCMRMESLGIPCEHIVCVLVHEDIEELPRSLVLPRWTKTAKVSFQNARGLHWDSLMLSQYGCLMDWFRQLANFACRDNERFIFTREMAMNLLKQFKEEDAAQKELVNDADIVRDGV